MPSVDTAHPAVLPHIVDSPQDITVNPGTLIILHAFALPVGSQRIWRRNGVPLANQPGPYDLAIPNSQVSQSGLYDVLVCSECGCDTSKVAVVKVCSTPLVTVGNQIIRPLQGATSVSLAASVAGADSMRWFRNGVPLADGGRYLGAASATLQIAGPMQPGAVGFFQLRGYGNCSTAIGKTMDLAVIPSAPAWTSAANACSSLAVRWAPVPGVSTYRLERTPPFTLLNGVPHRFTTDTLWVDTELYAPLSLIGATYQYTIKSVVEDTLSSTGVTSPVVSPAVRAVVTRLSAASVTIERGGNLALTHFWLPFPATHVWRKNGVPLTTQPAPGAMSLVLTNLQLSAAGTYDVLACNECGCDSSAATVVRVCSTPVVTAPQTYWQVDEGVHSIPLATVTTGADSLRWFRNNELLTDNVRYQGTTTSTLRVTGQFTSPNDGYYWLVAYGNCSTKYGPPMLVGVAPCWSPPTIQTQPLASQTVTLGTPASLTVGATGCTLLAYRWFHWNAQLGYSEVIGATGPTLSIPAVGPSDLGGYQCWINARSYVRSAVAEIVTHPEPRFLTLTSTGTCGGADIHWTTNLPAAVDVCVVADDCVLRGEPPVASFPAATTGTFSVAIPPGTNHRQVYLRATNVNGVAVSQCVMAYPRSTGPELVARVAIQPYYASTDLGTAAPAIVTVTNIGCTAFEGEVVLDSLQFYSSTGWFDARDQHGLKVTPLQLTPSSFEPGEERQFEVLYFPVTPPPPEQFVGRSYLGALHVGAPAPRTIVLTGSLGLDSTRPR